MYCVRRTVTCSLKCTGRNGESRLKDGRVKKTKSFKRKGDAGWRGIMRRFGANSRTRVINHVGKSSKHIGKRKSSEGMVAEIRAKRFENGGEKEIR